MGLVSNRAELAHCLDIPVDPQTLPSLPSATCKVIVTIAHAMRQSGLDPSGTVQRILFESKGEEQPAGNIVSAADIVPHACKVQAVMADIGW